MSDATISPAPVVPSASGAYQDTFMSDRMARLRCLEMAMMHGQPGNSLSEVMKRAKQFWDFISEGVLPPGETVSLVQPAKRD